jgi:hypothetical protein
MSQCDIGRQCHTTGVSSELFQVTSPGFRSKGSLRLLGALCSEATENPVMVASPGMIVYVVRATRVRCVTTFAECVPGRATARGSWP